MTLNGKRTYVGFGFGAIQAGLFLYEAFCAHAFGRLVIAEVMPEVVDAVRQAGGYFSVNIAHANRIEPAVIGPLEIENPASEADRRRLIAAIAQAEEIGTAIPSVNYYVSAGPGSLHQILAAGLRQKTSQNGPRAVVYAAENHNHAAEILEKHVMAEIPVDEQAAVRAKVRFLNTVIGKMSGTLTNPAEIEAGGLAPTTPAAPRAFLVEEFNRILISKIQFDPPAPPFARGLSIFAEKDDLLPFEEAKLYGHNATHALAAYLGLAVGAPRIADLPAASGILPFLRAAFIEESGAALIRKYNGLDPLFTPAGYTAYANDLLARMTNPYLRDTAERVGRDPARKLGWDDRLIGTMRLVLSQGLEPRRYAFGAAAALFLMPDDGQPSRSRFKRDLPAEALLSPLWQAASPHPREQKTVLDLIEQARRWLKDWLAAGCPNLEEIFS